MAAAAAAAAAEKEKNQSDDGSDTNGKSNSGKVPLPPNDNFFLGFGLCGLGALNSIIPDQLRVLDLFHFFVFSGAVGGVFLSCFSFSFFFGPSATRFFLQLPRLWGPSARFGGYRSRDEGSKFG